jgi:hypothetical protein
MIVMIYRHVSEWEQVLQTADYWNSPLTNFSSKYDSLNWLLD